MQGPCQYLNKIFLLKQIRNPKYSVRSFARDCSINSGRMSQLLNGKMAITLRTAKAMTAALNLSQEEKDHFLRLVEGKKDLLHKGLESEFISQGLSALQFRILSLIETMDFKFDIEWMAQRLGVSSSRISDNLELLLKSDLVLQKDGVIQVNYDVIETASKKPDTNIRKFHQETLRELIEQIEKTDFSDRELILTTLAMDPKLLPEAKKKINSFMDKLAQWLESSSKKEVYQLSLQLVPFSAKKN